MRVKETPRWLLCVVTVVGLIVCTSSPHASQTGARLAALAAARALQSARYDFVAGDAGRLGRGQSIVVRTTLYRGNTYAFIAGGDEDAYDVDIAVYDENGNLIRRDNDDAPVAVAEDITPRWTGTFFVKVTMYRSTSYGAYYILLLGRR